MIGIHIHNCISTHTHTYTNTYIYTKTPTYIHMHIPIHAYTSHTHAHTHVHMYIPTHTCAFTYQHTRTCTHTHTYIYIHIRIHTHFKTSYKLKIYLISHTLHTLDSTSLTPSTRLQTTLIQCRKLVCVCTNPSTRKATATRDRSFATRARTRRLPTIIRIRIWNTQT